MELTHKSGQGKPKKAYNHSKFLFLCKKSVQASYSFTDLPGLHARDLLDIISTVFSFAGIYSDMAVFLGVIAVLCSILLPPVYSSEDLLPFEPIQYVKGQLPDSVSTPFTNLIGDATPTQAAEFITKAKVLLKSHLGNSGTSAILIKGERVMVQRRASGLQWDSKIKLPYSNTISLISSLLPILLEGYKGTAIKDPIEKVLRGKDLTHPLVAGRESLSFMDILNKLPSVGKNIDLDSSSLLSSLLANGELSIHFVNAILDNAAHEAWMDALMAIGSADIQLDSNGQLIMDLNSLLQFALTIAHDLKNIGAAVRKERIPLDNGKYLFGWWFNCPKDSSSSCLIPSAPTDTIFSLSPDLRLYVTPSLELTLMILGPGAISTSKGKTLESIADILIEDTEIWRQLVSSVAEDKSTSEAEAHQSPGANTKTVPESPNENIETVEEKIDTGDEDLIVLIHWVWPILVFLFWVTFSHLWVYWILHIFWIFLTSVSKRAYSPRPKTAAESKN